MDKHQPHILERDLVHIYNMSETDLSFSSLGLFRPTVVTESNESVLMLLSSNSLRFEMTGSISGPNVSSRSHAVLPERLQKEKRKRKERMGKKAINNFNFN